MNDHHFSRAAEPAHERVDALIALAYELLDAHADTARLVDEEAGAEDWRGHLAYLRDLQRVGRETLARAACPGATGPAAGAPAQRASWSPLSG
jgi:hypothetical protein